MIVTYESHKSIEIKESRINIIATSSPIVYRDLIEGLQDNNDLVRSMTDDY